MTLHPDVERLALLGWRMVPATSRKKGMFKGYLDAATSDLDTLAAWAREYPRACWKAVPHGSGVWFLDVDVPGPEHDADGVAALRDLCALHGPLPPRPHGRSPSGGHLLVFRDDGHPIKNGSGYAAPGLDALAGRVCPMVPPSRRNAGAYRWIVAPWDLAPPPAPEWLLRLLAPPPAPPAPRRKPTADMGRRVLHRSLDRIASAAPGTRNATLNQQAFSVARWIGAGLLDEAEAIGALYAAGRALGLADPEVRGTIKSGVSAGLRHPLTGVFGHA